MGFRCFNIPLDFLMALRSAFVVDVLLPNLKFISYGHESATNKLDVFSTIYKRDADT